jgi:hypothetical protein
MITILERAFPLRLDPALVLGLSLALSMPPPAAAGPAGKPEPDYGIRYTNDIVPDKPWSIHIVQIERGRSDFELCTTLGKGDAFGMGTVSEQIKTLPRVDGQPLAAINGDFYEKRAEKVGRPRDLQIRFGEIVTDPDGHTCFWMAPDGAPCMTNVFSQFRVILPNGTETKIRLNQLRDNDAAVLYTAAYGPSTGTDGGVEYVLERATNSSSSLWLPLQAGREYTARVREVRRDGNTPLSADIMVLSLGPGLEEPVASLQAGAALRIVTETVPDLRDVKMAIGGGPALVWDGKAMQWTGLIKLRHPRTAVGWNQKHIFLVEVDGRQSDISIGMTLPELADYMVNLGCEEAMNFDGGGSATLWAFGMVKNSPSEGEERPAPNALVVIKRAEPKP